MKILFQNYSYLLWLPAIVFSMSGCKKDTDSVTEICRVVSQYRTDDTNPSYITYYYDEQGRISAILGNSLYGYLTYTADSALYKAYQQDGTLNNNFSLKVDANGRFLTGDNRTYQYDTEGHLIKEVGGTVLYDYIWQDGNMVKQQITINGILSFTLNYTYYTEYENKARWDYNHSGLNCFFGKEGKNLIKHIETITESNGTASETEWTYKLNEKGIPYEMKILFVSSGTFSTYLYNYECI